MTLTYAVTLQLMHCSECGIAYGMDGDYERRRREDKKTWYCPNGHSQVFIGQTEAQKERVKRQEAERQLERAKREASTAWEAYDDASQKLGELRKDLTAQKRARTVAEKRAAAAACPCCKRTFVQLRRHLDAKHPEYVQEHLG